MREDFQSVAPDQWSLRHMEILEQQILGPHSRSAESETLELEISKLSYPCFSVIQIHSRV